MALDGPQPLLADAWRLERKVDALAGQCPAIEEWDPLMALADTSGLPASRFYDQIGRLVAFGSAMESLDRDKVQATLGVALD